MKLKKLPDKEQIKLLKELVEELLEEKKYLAQKVFNLERLYKRFIYRNSK